MYVYIDKYMLFPVEPNFFIYISDFVFLLFTSHKDSP